MKKIELIEIDKTSFEEAVRLRVGEGQEKYVATNAISIAQSKFYPTLHTEGVVSDEGMVGFVMFGFDPDDDRYSLVRLMIDERHQGKGYGRLATEAVLARLQQIEECNEVFLSYVPENNPAEKLYESVGFVKTGEVDEESGEVVMKYEFASEQ